MTHKTRGIVLRSIKYGETSLVVTIFTELFGIQTYIVNGARSAKKTGNKYLMYQPAAILDLEVYHQDQKNMQRIKEASWSVLLQQVHSDVIRNSVALFIVELLLKSLKQPESHPNLFYFCEDVLLQLDQLDKATAANLPLYFALHVPQFFGFQIQHDPGVANDANIYLDLKEGIFTKKKPSHNWQLEGIAAKTCAEILTILHPRDLSLIKLNHYQRRALLASLEDYFALHIADFGKLKTLPVLQDVLG